MFNCSKSPYICYRDKYPCKVSEKKLIFNPFIIKNGEYDPRKLAIDKNFVQFWSSLYMGPVSLSGMVPFQHF